MPDHGRPSRKISEDLKTEGELYRQTKPCSIRVTSTCDHAKALGIIPPFYVDYTHPLMGRGTIHIALAAYRLRTAPGQLM